MPLSSSLILLPNPKFRRHYRTTGRVTIDGGSSRGAAPSIDHDADDHADIARLAALPLLIYEREREPAAERLGCRVAILDRLVEDARASANATPRGNANNGSGAGHALATPELDPWPEPVEGAALLSEITAEVRRYVVLGDSEAVAVGLWAVATHTFDVFWTFPRLFLAAPEKGCGKSTLLDVMSRLVPRPMIASHITPAALFLNRAITAGAVARRTGHLCAKER